MNRIEWPILSHSDPIQFSQVPPADGDSGDKILKMNHFGYITCTNSGFDVSPERMESDIRQFLSTPVSKCNEIVA